MDCVFCRELLGSRDTNFARLYPEIQSRVIAETESLVAFPCIGQLVEGHFLVIPRAHDCTLAQTHSRVVSANTELSALLLSAHKALGVNPIDSLYFEHGALGDHDGGCGIYHAHLHILPNAGHIDGRVFIQKTDCYERGSILHAYESISPERPYALIGSTRHGFKSWSLTEPLPSQTLRKKVAEALQINSWDWREAEREGSMMKVLAGVNS